MAAARATSSRRTWRSDGRRACSGSWLLVRRSRRGRPRRACARPGSVGAPCLSSGVPPRPADRPRPWRRSAVAPRPRAPPPHAPCRGDRPVARVVLDLPLSHLDRPFDYTVSRGPGRRGRPRARGCGSGSPAGCATASCWSGRDASDHDGTLAPLHKVVSAEPVLTPGGGRGWSAASPTTTPAASPTSSGSPCRRGTPPPRRRAPVAGAGGAAARRAPAAPLARLPGRRRRTGRARGRAASPRAPGR